MCGEAEVLLAEVQLPDVAVALRAVLLASVIGGARRVVGRQSELCGDLLEWILGVGQAELVAEELGFGESSVGRCGAGEVERWVDQLLGLLPKDGRQYSSSSGVSAPVVFD
jgi:hypothetical protein